MSMYDDVKTDILADEIKTRKSIEISAMRGFWTMKNGTKIHVSDMSESHIRNTIKFIKERDKVDLYLPWIDRLERELKERGLE